MFFSHLSKARERDVLLSYECIVCKMVTVYGVRHVMIDSRDDASGYQCDMCCLFHTNRKILFTRNLTIYGYPYMLRVKSLILDQCDLIIKEREIWIRRNLITIMLTSAVSRVRPFTSKALRYFASVPGVVHLSIDEARDTTALALEKIGWDHADAALQAEIMTAAELCGNNQGLVKMYQPEMMAPAPGCSKPVVERETVTSAVINGNQSPGMLAAVMAADLAVEKLEQGKEKGVGPISIVCANNTSTSSGQLAFYVERMARKGYIGLAMCNSPEFVAPANGAKPVFGTNPFAVGIPQKGPYPFTVRA